MRCSIRKGLSFGLTSGIITTLGLIVGLHSSTHSKIVIIGGILVIAIADALSDALGIHISEEFENKHTVKEIWESTLATFATKFFMALTFIVPIVYLSLYTAIVVSIFWGLSLITILSWYIAREQENHHLKVIFEHLLIAVLVIVVTHYVGDWVATLS
jgi:VIT1/CCC1 family predicted Fe2+/Mn2+ transporter